MDKYPGIALGCSASKRNAKDMARIKKMRAMSFL
jgi:hypothetical protein